MKQTGPDHNKKSSQSLPGFRLQRLDIPSCSCPSLPSWTLGNSSFFCHQTNNNLQACHLRSLLAMFFWLRIRSREADHERERPQYIPLENVEEAGECSSDDSTLREVSLEDEKPSSHLPRPLRRAAQRVINHLQFLLPSFLQSVSGEPKKLHPTAWLGVSCRVFPSKV